MGLTGQDLVSLIEMADGGEVLSLVLSRLVSSRLTSFYFSFPAATEGTEGLFSPIATRQQQRHFGHDDYNEQHTPAPRRGLAPSSPAGQDLGRKRLHDLISAGAAVLGPETPTVLKHRLAENVFGSDEIYAHVIPPQVERHRENVLAGHYSLSATGTERWRQGLGQRTRDGSGGTGGGLGGAASRSTSGPESEIDRIHRKIQAMSARGRNGELSRYDE